MIVVAYPGFIEIPAGYSVHYAGGQGMFGRIGPMELILILVIALVIFGPKKLPEIGKAVGDAIKAFRKSSEKIGDEIDKVTKPEDEEKPKISQASNLTETKRDPKA
jgi:sec-independent protein translocase protein TatA